VAFAGWGLLAALLACVVLAFTGGSFLAAGVSLLLVPLARPLAAPLALAHNRTR
jgi:hypothetical protein